MPEKIPQDVFAGKKKKEVTQALTELTSEGEREKLKVTLTKEAKIADPLTSSPVVLDKTFLKKQPTEEVPYQHKVRGRAQENLPVYVEEKTGRKYVGKKPELRAFDHDVHIEHFVTLLSKGILQSSDLLHVPYGKGNDEVAYFSHVQKLENTKETSQEALHAEQFLLNYVFNDWDKSSADGHRNNMVVDEQNRFAHYDYGRAFGGGEKINTSASYPFAYKESEDPETLKKAINTELDHLQKYKQDRTNPWKRTALTALEKLHLLPKSQSPKTDLEIYIRSKKFLDAVKDKKFFQSIAKKSGLDSVIERFDFLVTQTSKTQKKMGDELRIEELRERIEKRLTLLVETIEGRDPALIARQQEKEKINMRREQKELFKGLTTNPRLIALDGPDGAGKTTIAKSLVEALNQQLVAENKKTRAFYIKLSAMEDTESQQRLLAELKKYPDYTTMQKEGASFDRVLMLWAAKNNRTYHDHVLPLLDQGNIVVNDRSELDLVRGALEYGDFDAVKKILGYIEDGSLTGGVLAGNRVFIGGTPQDMWGNLTGKETPPSNNDPKSYEGMKTRIESEKNAEDVITNLKHEGDLNVIKIMNKRKKDPTKMQEEEQRIIQDILEKLQITIAE